MSGETAGNRGLLSTTDRTPGEVWRDAPEGRSLWHTAVKDRLRAQWPEIAAALDAAAVVSGVQPETPNDDGDDGSQMALAEVIRAEYDRADPDDLGHRPAPEALAETIREYLRKSAAAEKATGAIVTSEMARIAAEIREQSQGLMVLRLAPSVVQPAADNEEPK